MMQNTLRVTNYGQNRIIPKLNAYLKQKSITMIQHIIRTNKTRSHDHSIWQRKAVENCLYKLAWHKYLEQVDRRQCIWHEEDHLGKVQILSIFYCKRPKVYSKFTMGIKSKNICFQRVSMLIEVLIWTIK